MKKFVRYLLLACFCLYILLAVFCSIYNLRTNAHIIFFQTNFSVDSIVHQHQIAKERTLIVATNADGYVCIAEMGMTPMLGVAFFPDVSTITSSFIIGTNGVLTEYNIEKTDSVEIWKIKSDNPAILQRRVAYSEHGLAKLKTLEVGFQTSANEVEQAFFQHAVGDLILYITEYIP